MASSCDGVAVTEQRQAHVADLKRVPHANTMKSSLIGGGGYMVIEMGYCGEGGIGRLKGMEKDEWRWKRRRKFGEGEEKGEIR